MHPADVPANTSINANVADPVNSWHDAIQLQHIWLVRSPVTTAIIQSRTAALLDGTVNLATRMENTIKINKIEKFINYLVCTARIEGDWRDSNLHLDEKETNARYCSWNSAVDLLHFPLSATVSGSSSNCIMRISLQRPFVESAVRWRETRRWWSVTIRSYRFRSSLEVI